MFSDTLLVEGTQKWEYIHKVDSFGNFFHNYYN